MESERAFLTAYGRVVIDSKNIFYRVNIDNETRTYIYANQIPEKVSANIDKRLCILLLDPIVLKLFKAGTPIIIKKTTK